MKFFDEKDFPFLDCYHDTQECIRVCNAKLEKALGPVVYGSTKWLDSWGQIKRDDDTHQARLFNIQEIKKICVEHEPYTVSLIMCPAEYKCKKCGKKLTFKWEVADE